MDFNGDVPTSGQQAKAGLAPLVWASGLIVIVAALIVAALSIW